MISVKVTYTVKPGFVQKNKENINSFIKDFRELKNSDFRYTAFLSGDGKTFIHLSMYKNEEIQNTLLNTDSFKSFQKQRDESGLENQPTIEEMTVVDASHPVFSEAD